MNPLCESIEPWTVQLTHSTCRDLALFFEEEVIFRAIDG